MRPPAPRSRPCRRVRFLRRTDSRPRRPASRCDTRGRRPVHPRIFRTTAPCRLCQRTGGLARMSRWSNISSASYVRGPGRPPGGFLLAARASVPPSRCCPSATGGTSSRCTASCCLRTCSSPTNYSTATACPRSSAHSEHGCGHPRQWPADHADFAECGKCFALIWIGDIRERTELTEVSKHWDWHIGGHQ